MIKDNGLIVKQSKNQKSNRDTEVKSISYQRVKLIFKVDTRYVTSSRKIQKIVEKANVKTNIGKRYPTAKSF